MKKIIVIVLIILAIFGVLRAIDALAAANPPALGGTGTSIVPSSGQTLIGNTSGTYTPTLLYSLFGATAPLSYNASTGVVSWTNSNGYTTTTIQSVLNVFSATGLATYNSSTGVITVSSSSLALGSASHNSTGDFLASSTAFVSSFNTRTGAVTLSSGDVTSALGYTPYNSTNPSNYATTTIQSVLKSLSAAGLATYNSSTGIFTVSSSSLSLGTASQHPASDFLASSTVVNTPSTTIPTIFVTTFNGSSGIVTYAPSTTIPTVYVSSFNTRTGAVTLSSGDVTTALGFTPYNASNPGGYTTTTIASVLKSLSAGGTGLTYNSSTGAITWTNPGYITAAPATTTFNNITTSTLSIKAGSGVGIASSTDGTGQAIITISATGGSSSTIVTGVSPIIVSQSGVNATTSCPTCITSAVQTLFGLSTSSISITTSTAASTFNVTSTGGNTIKITIPSNVGFFTNDSGYLTGNQSITISGAVSGSGTTAITTVYNTSTLYSFFSASGPIGYNASTGAFSFTNPGYISTSTGLTVSNFASPNISQWTNNSGYITTSTNNFGGLTNGSITAVSPIFWSSTSTITCPTCIVSNLGNWAGTWQGVNSSTFYPASNPNGYITTSTGITVANLATSSISQFVNDAHYVTSTSGIASYNVTSANPFISVATTTTSANLTFSSSSLNLGSASTHPSTDFLASSTTYLATNTGNWAGTWQGVNSTTFYLASNPLGFVTSTGIATNTGNWAGTWQGVNSTTFYLAANPSHYISSSTGSGLYYPLSSNPAGYVTSTSGGVSTSTANTWSAIQTFTGVTNNGNITTTNETVSSTLNLTHTNASGTWNYNLSNDGNYLEINTTGTISGTPAVPYNIILQNCPPAGSTSTALTSSSWECALSQAENLPDGSRDFVDWDTEYYPTGTSPNIASGWFDNARGTSSILFPYNLSWNDGVVNHVGFVEYPTVATSASQLNAQFNLGTNGKLYVGTSATSTGSFVVNQNGANTCVGIYDAGANTIYGIADSLPLPAGCIGIGGYYHGIGVGGSTAGAGSPIFGILNSSQGSNGRGHTAFTAYDTNEIDTFNNELDDGAGNAFVSGTLQVYGQLKDGGGNKYVTSTGIASYNVASANPFISVATTTTSATLTFSSSSLGLGTAATHPSTDFLSSSTTYVATTSGNWAGTVQGKTLGTISTFASTDYLTSSTVVNTPSSTIYGAGAYLGTSGSNLTVSSTLASSSITLAINNATTTAPSFTKASWDYGRTISKITCVDEAGTTTLQIYKSTGITSDTNLSNIIGSLVCGTAGGTTTSFTTSTVAAGEALFINVTSTAGTPTLTTVVINGFKF